MPVQRLLFKEASQPLWQFQVSNLSTEDTWPACI